MKYFRTERIYEAIGWPLYKDGKIKCREEWIDMVSSLANGVRLQATYRPDQSGQGMNTSHDIYLDFLAATPALIEYVQNHSVIKPQYLTSTQKDVVWEQLKELQNEHKL